MKLLVFVIMLTFTSLSLAQDWRNGDEKFDFTNRMTSSAKVNIKTVDDPNKVCNEQSHKRGLGGFKVHVSACTFWNHAPLGSTCDIYLGKKTTMHEIGHEIRHCFAGSFH